MARRAGYIVKISAFIPFPKDSFAAQEQAAKLMNNVATSKALSPDFLSLAEILAVEGKYGTAPEKVAPPAAPAAPPAGETKPVDQERQPADLIAGQLDNGAAAAAAANGAAVVNGHAPADQDTVEAAEGQAPQPTDQATADAAKAPIPGKLIDDSPALLPAAAAESEPVARGRRKN